MSSELSRLRLFVLRHLAASQPLSVNELSQEFAEKPYKMRRCLTHRWFEAETKGVPVRPWKLSEEGRRHAKLLRAEKPPSAKPRKGKK